MLDGILFVLANVPAVALICLGMWIVLVIGLIWEELREMRPSRKGRIMTEKLIAEQWTSFESAALPPHTPAVQRKEMQRAFYAGAAGFYHILMTKLDPGTEETDADMARMRGLHDELEAFAASGRDSTR